MDERSCKNRINNSTYWVKILFLIQRDSLLLIVNCVISFLSNITNGNKSSALKIHLQTTHSPVKKTFFHLSLSSGSPHWWHLQSFIKLNMSTWNIDGFINSYFSQHPPPPLYLLYSWKAALKFCQDNVSNAHITCSYHYFWILIKLIWQCMHIQLMEMKSKHLSFFSWKPGGRT